ncbi:MAG: MBL fold metallo-hydrolase [SAR202 cluster bacterium]|nr:MBL fold metallo-hydrolase [SAR202 cluster bacterium]
MQILPDIYLLSGHAFGFHPNFYLVHSDRGNVVIDSGIRPSELEWADQHLKTWGISIDKVDALLITHSHYDHIGNAAELRKRGAKVHAGPSDAEGIELGDNRTIPYVEGPVPPCKVDRVLQDGDIIEAAGFRFEAIHVPGHTTGCIVYQLKHGGRTVWFTGDVLMAPYEDYEPQLGWKGSEDFDKPTYIKSLRRLASMKPDCVLAGHFIPYLRDGWKLVGRAYMKALLEWR